MWFLKNERQFCHFLKVIKYRKEYICVFNYLASRNYCITKPVISKNDSLAKYVETYRKEFQAHRSGKFRGMRKNDAQKKVNIINNLMDEASSAYDDIRTLNELYSENLNDEAFLKSVNTELEQQKTVMENAEEAILLELMPEDENESCNEIILEVTAGVGGQEAMLFAQNLYELYCSYIDFKKWNCELTDLERSELGGVRHSSIIISGPNCYKFLRFEGGVHRVQRIPKTEKGSRMHTSTATVAILPQPSEVDIIIDDRDLKVETKTARGPGGQHVNKTETAVRVHHLPSGIVVDCQVHKSQYKNKKICMQKLRSKLYEIELEKTSSEVQNLRKFQVGTRSRNEKVRTYNFPQDRITDHRFNVTVHNLERYFEDGEHFNNFLHSLLRVYNGQNRKEFLDMLQSTYS